jgi:hypothetical protein
VEEWGTRGKGGGCELEKHGNLHSGGDERFGKGFSNTVTKDPCEVLRIGIVLNRDNCVSETRRDKIHVKMGDFVLDREKGRERERERKSFDVLIRIDQSHVDPLYFDRFVQR